MTRISASHSCVSHQCPVIDVLKDCNMPKVIQTASPAMLYKHDVIQTFIIGIMIVILRAQESWDISIVDAFLSTFFPNFGAPPAPPIEALQRQQKPI